MPMLTAAVAVVAALLMTGCAVLLVRRSVAIPLVAILVTGSFAIGVSVILAFVTGATSGWIAASIASGAFPVAVPLVGVTRIGPSSAAATIGAAIWGAVVVPIGVLAPFIVNRICAGACVSEDFGGALPFVIGSGAFLLVPSVVTIGRNRMQSGTGSRPRDLALALGLWASFVVWLMALEGDVDGYMVRIAAAAILAPAFGAIGWELTDRIRGIHLSAPRDLRLGLLAGMGGILAGVVAVDIPWANLIGVICGIAGALAHDSKGMRTAAPATRAAVAMLVVGAIGMVAPGIVGYRLGFVFAARSDVIVAQLVTTLAMTVVALAVSVPVGLLLSRRARSV